jgi:uncharacterized repeat protein (TIGR01451 family)
MRQEREQERKLTIRHRWYAGGLATILAGALVFTGVTPAVADEVVDDVVTTQTETTTDETTAPPAEEAPAEEQPAEEVPAEEQPAEETSAEEQPAEEQPAEETPAEEAPAEETPAEETPAEEQKTDDAQQPQARGLVPGDGLITAFSLLPECNPNGSSCVSITRTVSIIGGGPASVSDWEYRATVGPDWHVIPASPATVSAGTGNWVISALSLNANSEDYTTSVICTEPGGNLDWNAAENTLEFDPGTDRASVCSFTHVYQGPATITVHVGGDRSGGGIAPLAGVTLRLYSGGDGGPNNPFVADWATCVSDASGDCVFTVPNIGVPISGGQSAQTGGNGGRQFWIVQEDQPAGWRNDGSIATGGSGQNVTQYSVRTPAMAPSGVYDSLSNFMIDTGNTNARASGGIWQVPRVNPVYPASCGLDVALIIDLSGSLAGDLEEVQDASNAMVTALEGTNSRVGVYTFASNAPATAGGNLAITQVATAGGADIVRSHINGFTTPTGGTNWDRGIGQVPTGTFDVAIVITDGNPTFYGNAEGPGSFTRFREVENGVFSANRLKAPQAALAGLGTRVIALGVGDGIDGPSNNLQAISGVTLGSDYFQSPTFTNAETVLRNLALGECLGSLTVVKQVVPSSNTGEDITGAQPAEGWTFTATSQNPNVSVQGSPGITAAGTGAVNFPLTFDPGVTSGTVQVLEDLSLQPGFTLVTQGGNNATCTATAIDGNTSPVAVTNVPGQPGFTISVPAEASVSCTVFNRPPLPQAGIVVDKFWRINGTTYTNANNPLGPKGLTAQLLLGTPGTNQDWGVERTGLTAGDTIQIDEQVTIPPSLDLCVVDDIEIRQGSTGTGTILTTADPPYTSAPLQPGTNAYSITNVLTCEAALTLEKSVANGAPPAPNTAWTLDAIPGAGAIEFAPGTTGVTAPVTPLIRYALAESGGPGTYIQTVAANATITPPSTGSWQCQQVLENGTVVPGGTTDGLNGGVIVLLGERMRCTAVNQTAQLTLLKLVVNDDGGSAQPAAWTLTADPGTNAFGLTTVSVAGAAAPSAANTFNVRPGHVYTIGETSAVTGYAQVKLQRFNGTGWDDVVGWDVSVPALGQATYRIVNDDIAPKLTLVKQVTNNDGGTAEPDEWTLTATSAEGINLSGTSGAPEVTSQPVTANEAYTLNELNGPSGYDWTTLSCTGYPNTTKAAPAISLQPGDDVTCTFTNDDQPGNLTLLKVVDDTNGGSAVPADWDGMLLAQRGADAQLSFDHNETKAVPAGVYTLDELQNVANYTWSNLTCSPGATSMDDKTVTVANGANVTCTFTNIADKPTLTLVKNVDNQNGVGSRTADEWQLSAAGEGGFLNAATTSTDGGLTASTGAKTVNAETTYTLSESVISGYTAGDWTCDSGIQVDDGEIQLPIGADVTCEITNTAIPAEGSISKKVVEGSPVQLLDGTWQIVYEIEVENTSTTSTLFYDLSDELLYGGGITPLTASWTGPNDTDVPFAPPAGPATLATNVSLAPEGTHIYTVTVIAEIADGTEDGTAWQCSSTASPNRGFLNVATLTVDGEETEAPACAEPVFPTIDKTAGTPTWDAATGKWTVTYTIAVTNPSSAESGTDIQVSVIDTLPTLPMGWTPVGEWQAVAVGGAPAPTDAASATSPWTIWSGTLPKGTTYSYTVTGVIQPVADADPIGVACDDDGLVNLAAAVSGDVSVEDDACVGIDTPPVEVVKSDGTVTQLEDGNWQIDYTVTVTNNGLNGTVYTLTDTPALGAGFDLVSGAWLAPAPVANTPIEAGGSDEFTYRVVASFDDTVEEPQLECVPGQGGAFFNEADVTFPGGTNTDDGCAEPGAPTVTKTAAAALAGAGGQWTLTYTVEVSNDSGMTLAYTLNDTPLDLPAGVNLTTPWTVTGPVADPDGAGSAALTPGWNGDTQIEVATGVIPDAATHTYSVTAGVTLTVDVEPDDLVCGNEPVDGEGFWNTATVSNGVYEDESSDCVDITPVPVEVDKTDGSVTQLDGGIWQITYTVTVTNTNPLPSVYTLDDTPQFDPAFTVLTEGWQGDPVVTNVPIEAGGSDEYTYVVTAQANVDPVPESALRCTENGGGFFNTATVTFPGGSDSDSGCAVPATPTVDKVALTSTQDAATGVWTISYEVRVANTSGIQLWYSVSDEPEPFPTGVTAGTWSATGPVPTDGGEGGGSGERNENWDGDADTELGTGLLPDGAIHTYTVTTTVTVTPDVTVEQLDCLSQTEGAGLWNGATVTNGAGGNSDRDCAEIDRPEVEIGKDVTDVSQDEDGNWIVVYDVTVTNTSDEYSAVYDLTDELVFGGDITIVEASWTGPSALSPGVFADPWLATLADDEVLAAEASDTYTVTAIATIDADGWAGQTLLCQDGERPGRGGFLNTATATAGGVMVDDADCAEPKLPEVDKQPMGAVQDPGDPDSWLVSYQITVTPSGFDTFYTLNDVPGYPAGVTLGAGTAQRTDIGGQPVLPITSGGAFPAAPVAMGAEDAPHTWTVTWTATLTDEFDPETELRCGEGPGDGGYYNAIELIQGADVIDDADTCIPVIDRVYPTVAKTVTSTTQDAETGLWTIEYELVATLADNEQNQAAEYDLTDALEFGGDIEIQSATWSGQGQTDVAFDEPAWTADIATDKAIADGTSHTYTVTVVADVTEAAIDEGTTVCFPDSEDPSGGFLNTAVLESGGVEIPVEACAEPAFPTIAKDGGATTDNGDGTWDISYDVTVTFPAPDGEYAPDAVAYVLTDAPALPTGVELDGDWTAEAASAGTPAPSTPTWDGEGTWTVVADGELTAETPTHIYRISATVRVVAAPEGEPEICEELQQDGIVIWNFGTVTSGAYIADDDACQVVQFDDVGLEKTSVLPDGLDSVEPGDTFDYVLTVTNYGTREAEDVRVTDDDINERLEIQSLTVDPALTWGVAPGFTSDPNNVDLTIDSLDVGASATITITVLFTEFEQPPGELPAIIGDEEVPPTPELVEVLENTACVSTAADPVGGDRDGDPYAANCDDETVETRDVAALVYTQCINDAPLLGWSITRSESLAGEPITLTWTPTNPDVTPETSPSELVFEFDGAGTWNDVVPWPGAAFTPSGISIDYPGWRPLEASDYVPGSIPQQYFLPGTANVMTPEQQAQFVFNGLILDPSELDFAWRGLTTIVISVNPELTFTTGYPPATPDCAAARQTELDVQKTASVERTESGGSFTYDIAVENISDDAAAESVVVTDEIPADVRITGVNWPGKGDDTVFPNWETCEVTGADAGGYGGTLECVLFGPLQPIDSDNGGATAAPTITLSAVVDPDASASVITNVAVVDYHTFGDPSDTGRDADDAVVLLSALPPTGSGPVLPLTILAVLALLGGIAAIVVMRRRRGEPEPQL